MLKYLLCGLPFIPIALPCANTSSVDETVYKPIHEVCDQYGISPVCDDELQEKAKLSGSELTHPLDLTIDEMIREGYTPQQLYGGGSISIEEKRKLESPRI